MESHGTGKERESEETILQETSHRDRLTCAWLKPMLVCMMLPSPLRNNLVGRSNGFRSLTIVTVPCKAAQAQARC